jgi:hypothetical protein
MTATMMQAAAIDDNDLVGAVRPTRLAVGILLS